VFSGKLKTVFFTLPAILSIVFLSYFPVLKNDFVQWDDDVHLLDNISIQALDWEHVGDIFRNKVNNIYIPLTSLSFAAEHYFFKYNPFIYHLDNLILHLLVVIFIFFIGLRLGLSILASGIASLLFGIHPIHVESVAWVTERKDVLYAVFYAAAALSYLCYLDNRKYKFLVMTTILGVLSVLAKPMALSLPLILLFLDWFKKRKMDSKAILEKIPVCILMAAITCVTYFAHARIPGTNVVEGLLIWPWTFTFYLRQFLFPFFSVPVYRLPQPIMFFNFEYLISIAVFIFIIFSLIRLKHHRWFRFAVLFYFFSIFFLLRFDDLADTNIVADRFMYLPSLGFCFLFGLGAERLFKWKKSSVVGLILLIAILCFKSFQQCRIWTNSVTLWQHQLKYFPKERIALNNLATVLRDKEEYKAAEEEYRKVLREQGMEFVKNDQKVNYIKELYERAVQADPYFVDSYYNLGQLYKDLGRKEEAAAYYQQTIRLDPFYKDAYFSLGNLFRDSGDVSNAIKAYQQTLAVHPEDEDVYLNVITAYTKLPESDKNNLDYKRERDRLINQLRDLIEKKSPRATSYFNLGFVLGEAGDFQGAIAAYKQALDINPKHNKSLQNLGNAYFSLAYWEEAQGNFPQAVKNYQQSLTVNPKNAEAYYNIGNVYANLNSLDKAVSSYLKAVEYDSQHVNALVNLSILSYKQGSFDDAVKYCDQAIELGYRAPEGYLKTLMPYR